MGLKKRVDLERKRKTTARIKRELAKRLQEAITQYETLEKERDRLPTPAQPSKNVSRETIPATVIPAPFDIEEAQNIVFKPNAGPQTDFLASGEREVLYGVGQQVAVKATLH